MLQATGTPHPFSKPLSDARDLDDVPDAIFGSAMLKPRDSQSFMAHFGTKALHVSTRREAADELTRVREAGFAVILQEYVPGPATEHYFVDGFIDRNGTVRAVFVRQRLRMFPLDFGNSTAMVSVEPSAATQAVSSITSLLRGVDYRGIFSAEFKRDPRDGVFKILEVNTRAWWYVDFAARCGVDVCRMAYEDALERPVQTIERYDIGRALVFPYYDYFACQALRREGKLSTWGWLRSWMGAMQPVFQLADPKPGMLALAKTMTRFVRNRVGRFVPILRTPRPSLIAMPRPDIIVSTLAETEYADWNAFVAAAPTGSLYARTEYLDALCTATGGRFRVLGVRQGDQLLGGVGLYEEDTRFGVRVSPRLLLYYNGPVVRQHESKYPSEQTSRALKTLTALETEIRGAGYGSVKLKPRRR